MLFSIILFIVFISLSAFFSLSETAIFSLSALKLRKLSEKHPRQAKTIKALLEHPARTLSTINFGNMLVNIGISSLFTALFVETLGLGNAGLFLAIFISGFFILFLGEIFPKTFAIYLAEKISLTCAQLLDLFSWLFLPFIFIIEKIVAFFSLFLQWFPRKSLLSFDELKTAILVSRKEGQISEEEKGMISSVLEFKDTWVSEIMSHRVDMHAIDTLEPQQDVNKILQQKKHSKFPVYEGSSDNIIGILYAKDFFLDSGIDYHLLLKAPLFIPETKKIGELLKLFLEKKERIAIVLDEHGGTAGLVTLEDIEEEIFGEIYDEFETPKEFIEKINEKSYRLYAKTPVKALNLALNLNIPQEQNTIAGFILSQLGKIPHAEEILPFGNLEFFIERASTKRIISVILHIK